MQAGHLQLLKLIYQIKILLLISLQEFVNICLFKKLIIIYIKKDKGTSDPLRLEASFANIELVTEKSAQYWIEGCAEVKKEYP